jgi:hypothetical protein
MERLTRLGFVRVAASAAAALALAPKALASRLRVPILREIGVRNNGRPYLGDRKLFATVSPGVDGRGSAIVRFRLDGHATVELDVMRTALRKRTVVWTTNATFGPGEHQLAWDPGPDTAVGTYVLRLTVESGTGLRRVYGGARPSTPDRGRAPVVRVLGVEASFEKRSYGPRERQRLRIQTDASELTLQALRCGAEPEWTDRIDEMRGIPMGDPITIKWRARSAPNAIHTAPGDWPTGVYTLRITTEDERVGFAPYILRPAKLGAVRQAVVIPTNTWQAYNFYDADGDGFGDTWYAGGTPPVSLVRPYRDRGVPPRYRRYDLPFLRWLTLTGKTPEFICDDDLEAFASGDQLRALYDLVVFPGHTEYVTQHVYDVVTRYRDLGGRLIFLSANNFFWRVDRNGETIRRVRLWRNLGRPEAALVGNQYRANDDGSRQGVFYVTSTAVAPWLWEGTGLTDGSTFGEAVGGYGIEIDARAPQSPPGTIVLALIPNLYGPGINAEMTYYETPAGARVFAAGTLDFSGSATFPPMTKILENLWAHMTS